MLTTIFIILLIISQLFCFYIIALLNAKVAKFKDLEVRQEKIMREMEESISLYLVEIQEENDRLIKELSEVQPTKKVRKTADMVETEIERTTDKNEGNIDSNNLSYEQKVFVPKSIARNAYSKNKTLKTNNDTKTVDNAFESNSEAPIISFKEHVIKLHNQGKNIEEIAKLTNKGKTEIELLLKFQA
ncbi:hypothetical protein [Ureibacillus acetophenoni]|uniref:Coupling factor for flagellin transcription and translation n=1 Tax=Ureibacillus acetophenoni TaxID=614649 RepID=A0A285U5N9_9BACL|nr:hypothetical protein [Ureibacillus acetophenoni]SOC35581.1 hypothetical protein SAMN05877842_101499 [Ureibacillus acetophenoni]